MFGHSQAGRQIDGGGGLGIPVMNFAFKKAIEFSEKNGITATAIKNIGHTGRLGYYADYAANKGLMTILISWYENKFFANTEKELALKFFNGYCAFTF